MTFGSLFAGIGGFDLGLERAGMVCKWQVEIDPFCRAVLAKHWPGVRRYEDVRTVGGELEYVDVICGGFPCQDISVSGRGDGIDGERSGLWREFSRLIGELRPRYVLVENVSALLVRGMGRVLGDLAASGYDAEWDCLPAAAFGAPHRRDRVWLVAYPTDGVRRSHGRSVDSGEGASQGEARERSLQEWHRSAWDDGPPASRTAVADAVRERWDGRADALGGRTSTAQGANRTELGREALADTNDAGRRQQWRVFPIQAQLLTAECCGWWLTEPDVGRVAHGVSNRVDRLRGLGNSIVPQIAEWLGRRILEAEG